MRFLVLLLALIPFPVWASPIEMRPTVVSLEWDGQPLGGQMTWSLLEGETDGTATHLSLEFSIETFDWEPGGFIVFDVPIVSATSERISMHLFQTGPDLRWFWSAAAPPFSDHATVLIDLAGVPTLGAFGVFGSSSLDVVPVSFRSGPQGAVTAVPEPVSGLLLAAGALIVGAAVRRRYSTV